MKSETENQEDEKRSAKFTTDASHHIIDRYHHQKILFTTLKVSAKLKKRQKQFLRFRFYISNEYFLASGNR